MIPLSNWVVTAYPTRMELSDFFEDMIVIEMALKGPIRGFTLQQDLEKDICRIFGSSEAGYFEFQLFVDFQEKALSIKYARGEAVVVFVDGKQVRLQKGEVIDLIDVLQGKQTETKEKISLGSNRKQEINEIWGRYDLREMLPILYTISQSVLLPAEERITQLPVSEEGFSQFLATGFRSLFVPKRRDENYLGVFYEKLPDSLTPLYRLKAFQKAFRMLFLMEEDAKIQLLPNLFSTFHCGRFIGAKVQGAKIDFEWRSGKLRAVIIYPEKKGELTFLWPKEIQGCRSDKQEVVQGKQTTVGLKPGKRVILDRFYR